MGTFLMWSRGDIFIVVQQGNGRKSAVQQIVLEPGTVCMHVPGRLASAHPESEFC